MTSVVRHPPPRPLGAAETLESLTHWESTFRTYFKRDDAYKQLIRKSAKWNPLEIHYGQATETTGLKRTAAEVKEDLTDLLTTLAGFLPHSYLTDKLLKNTKNWSDVWAIIHEHYGVQVSSETLLDFEDLCKQTGETHRQFYERLLQHARHHLAPANVKVEEVDTGNQAETMSVSMMNMIALRKTDPALIKIIKTEYSTDIRKNVQLASLVPRIAPNIDSLLARYNNGGACNMVNVNDKVMDDIVINKVWGKSSRNSKKKYDQESPTSAVSKQSRNRGPFCPACYYLSQQLQTSIHFKHLPLDFPRKTVAVNMLKMEDIEHFTDTGKASKLSLPEIYQNNSQVRKTKSMQTDQLQDNTLEPPDFISYSKQLNKSPNMSTDKSVTASLDKKHNISDESICNSLVSSLQAAVYKLEIRLLQNNAVRKEKSPAVAVTIENRPALAILDEGSEINCLDEGLALKLNVQFVPTSCTALAAGSSRMKLVGQTTEDIKLYPQGVDNTLCWNLGKTVIVNNLGTDILVGEPGKVDNNIATLPHKKVVECTGYNGSKVRIPYCTKLTNKDFSLCRSTKTTTVYPGETISIQVPSYMRAYKYVCVAPRRTNFLPWVTPKVTKVADDGSIQFTNVGNTVVKVKKDEHLADIRSCNFVQESDLLDPARVRKLYDLDIGDASHLLPHDCSEQNEENFLSQVSID